MNRNQPSRFLVALLNPVNLAMLALSAGAGLCAAWWLFPIGIALWVVMFILIYFDPAMRLNYKMADRATLSRRFQPGFDRLEKAQVGLFNALSSSPRWARGSLRPVQDGVERLIEHSYLVCSRMSTLDNHLSVTRSTRNLEPELAALNEKIVATTVSHLKQEYEETRQSLEGRINSLRSIDNLLQSFEAQLSTLGSALEAIYTEAVRLQASGKEALRRDMPQLQAIIREQMTQLTDFEQQTNKPIL